MRSCCGNITTFLLLLVVSTQARTWRTVPSIICPSTTLPLSFMRGGSDAHDDTRSGIPIVPESTSSVSRGGSTTTKSLPSSTAATTTTPSYSARITGGIHAAGAIATTTTTPSVEAVPVNISSSELTNRSHAHAHHPPVSAREMRKAEKQAAKELKRHKKIAKKLKNRNATNLRRKVMHASFGFFFAALNHFIPKAQFVPGMTLLTTATLVMELLRYRKGFGWMNDALHVVLGSSLRKHEMDGKFTGSFYYFLGVTWTSALYPTTCATLGICQLAIADPTASYFGRATRHVYWSRIENGLGGFGRNKGILGFIGGALACVPMNYALLSKAQFTTVIPTTTALWTASLALGFAGAFADLAVPTPTLTLPKKVLGVRVPPFHVDDNVVVPVFSGFACQKVFQYLNFPADLHLAKFLLL